MHKSTSVPLMMAVAGTLLAAQQGAPPSPSAPEPLTWSQIVARPELWPKECALPSGAKSERETLDKGAVVPVLELREDGIAIGLPGGRGTLMRAELTDALQRANGAWLAMSQEQRALTLETLRTRADLWPTKVTLRVPQIGGDGAVLQKAGTEMDLGSFDGKWIRAQAARVEAGTLPFPLHATDFVDRVRAAIGKPVDGKGHRVLAELDGKVVSLATGKKAKVQAKTPPEFVVLYFSAGWCPGCRQFSPTLVDFYGKHKRDVGKRFEIVWVSRDRSAAEMQQYAKAHGFAWLAVAWDNLNSIPITQAYDPLGIPSVVVLDAKGALLADSYVGAEYPGPEKALAVLEGLLAKPK